MLRNAAQVPSSLTRESYRRSLVCDNSWQRGDRAIMRKIIIDCDTGRDDAIALALACASPDLVDLRGVTTVAGNIPLSLTQRNSRMVIELCGRVDVPVFAGADRPLLRPLATAEDAHGASGIEGFEVFEPSLPLQGKHAVDFILETLAAEPSDTVSLLVTGPMTNIALAAMRAPEVFNRVQEIVVMGGSSAARGNASPAAEFNIYVDAEAAARIFACGRPITVFGLDVTYQVLAKPEHRRRMAESSSRVARHLAPLMSPLSHWNAEKLGVGAIAMHDACTVAWLIWPDLFTVKHVNLEVETISTLTYGETVVDFWGYSKRPPNVRWAYKADGAAILDMMVERISQLR
jgi:purine nucleosidase